ncbi:allophanate hydrolase [Solwaraspora sp. WMMD1047]|uniref:allophanate hydrolase n=1 Tax=Solwaraspora sp. WMMD1047 TaxID=3016102 RepID=UPI0024176A53|nr:allophanate hydrolase [Solwaraspora sp. WMMD1047]MDG4833284.1 allophanate hydrolase [Solwaraspora sp. WMMD1047]
MPELIGSAAQLRAAYADGCSTPAGLAEQVLARLTARGATDPTWISLVPAAELRARAAELTTRRDRLADLPLYGIPFAVKDNIDVAGLPTTAACPAFGYHPSRDAPVVRRLLDAGAMLVGKTNLDQFATGLTGTRSPYGSCESVFGGGLIAGGSSSGSAVAVAAGLVTFALGTDTAGSGRVPAALNGIVGLKPSRGLLSTAGVVPACRSLDCVSVFAGDVADALTVLHATRGVTATDPWGRPLPAERVAPRMPATLRLGVPRAEDLEFFGDLGQQASFAAGRDRVAAVVAGTEPVGLGPLYEAGDLLYQGPWVAERLTGLDGFLREHPDAVLPVTRTVLESGRRYDAIDAFRAQHRLRELRAWADRLWERVDALVLPTVGTTFTTAEVAEDPIGRNTMLGRYTQFANLLDLAAVTVPNGFTADGRPASLTLLGPAFSDTTLAALAAAATPAAPAAPATAAVLAAPATPALLAAVVPAGSAAAPAVHATAAAEVGDRMLIAVVGRHLSGETRNGELLARGATLAEVATTAPLYRLYRLPADDGIGLPGLVRVATGDDAEPPRPGGSAEPPRPGGSIEVELWSLPVTALGGLLTGVPAPLSFGWLRLADGRDVIGFLCEAYAVGPDAEDISATGGWRAWRQTAATG